MSFRRVNVADLMGSLTKRTITDEGYLIAPGNLSRTGLQEYRAGELGLTGDGIDANKMIRLHRPAEEVFAPEALASFADKPITLQHPPKEVNAETWSDYAVGDVRDVASSAQHMTGTLIVRDKAAVTAVVDGTKQLSCGYGFDLDMTPGKTGDGQAYDGVQRNIRGNHIAIVDYARGGPACRIADSNPIKERTMATRKIVIDGISLELEDTHASLVEKIVGDAKGAAKTATDAVAFAEKRATDAETALAEERGKAVKVAADHAAKIAELEGKILQPEAVEALVAERAKVVGDAVVLVPDFTAVGKSVPAIRVEVLTTVMAKDERLKGIATAVLGGAELAKAPEGVVKAAFDAIRVASGAPATVVPGSVNDPATRRALLGNDGRNPTAPKPLSGRDLFIYRQNNGGKDPGQAQA